MNRPATSDHLLQHLAEQLSFLEASADAFDLGRDHEAKRLAATIRLLVHDTGRSSSLLRQLGRKGGMFLDSAFDWLPESIGSHTGLAQLAGDKWIAPLDEAFVFRWVPFESWWDKTVFVDSEGNRLSRKQLVLTAANQDGGAHVDPVLDETYAALVHDNSLGWEQIRSDGNSGGPLRGAELCAIRQISHELLRTLQPNYRRKPINARGLFISSVAVFSGPVDPSVRARVAAQRAPQKFRRNERCPCGSGARYKKCHGQFI